MLIIKSIMFAFGALLVSFGLIALIGSIAHFDLLGSLICISLILFGCFLVTDSMVDL